MVVTREPEWNDINRERAMRLVEHESTLCPCGCGLPIEDSSRDIPFVVDKFTCYATRAKERLKQMDRDKAKQANKPDGWDTGLIYYVREVVEPGEDQRGD